MVCVSMGGVLYRGFGKNDILGDFLRFSKKSFASVRLFSFRNFLAKKISKSDFRTPLTGGPNVRYDTPPPLIRGSLTSQKVAKFFEYQIFVLTLHRYHR